MAIKEDIKKLRSVHSKMKQRCQRLKDDSYKWYGAKGIKVSKNWQSFPNFLRDMGDSYKQGLWLDRIDNTKGYKKENCIWKTPIEQQNNRSNNQFFEFKGIKKTLNQWARLLGIKRSTLAQRYYVYNWTIKDCLTKGVHLG